MAELESLGAEVEARDSIENYSSEKSCESCICLGLSEDESAVRTSCSDFESKIAQSGCSSDVIEESWTLGCAGGCDFDEESTESRRLAHEALKVLVIEEDDNNEIEWPAPPAFCFQGVSQDNEPFSVHQRQRIPNVDALLQRILRERSSELNELQNGARPVTGSNARENLSDFFNRNLEPSSSANDRERSLPEDVQNLVQRSIVTSTLRRHAFRSTLESALASRLPASGNQVPTRAPQFARTAVSGTSTPLLSSIIHSDTISVASDVSDAASDMEQLQRAVNAGVQMLSETIEEDLTQLHHLHVVSSALNTDFRNDLERLVQQRVVSVGGGEMVQRFIQSLPSAPRPQSAVASQAARHPQNASSRPLSMSSQMNLSGEISSLKLQIEEMKRIMQMSFEVQMDTQRAVRQEVAAVFGAFMQQMAGQAATLPSHQTSAPSQNQVAVQAGACVICLENQVDTMLYQCGHMCVCHCCGIQLKTQGHRCPMCRAPIRDVVRAYKTQ